MPHTYRQGDEPVPGSGYRLVEFLGRGGFGEVWKATAPGGAEAALKIIHLGGLQGRKEFHALQLVKRIRHPHLVPIVAFWLKNEDGEILDDALTGQADMLPAETAASRPMRETMIAPPDVSRAQAKELIIAMGLGDISLFDRLQQCLAEGLPGIPHDELMTYMDNAAKAIDFLNSPIHDLGSGPAAIQHCDIKPHNLMTVGGAAQVCDFGLARMMGADRTTTAAATVAYAAPECLELGKPSDSTDQYSLAVSYYELKTGRLPYRDEALGAVIDAKRQGNLDFSQVTPPEQAILRRATSHDPQKRYRSALEMVRSLEHACAGDQLDRKVKAKGYNPRILGLTVAVTLIAVALWQWQLWQLHPNDRAGGPAATRPGGSPVEPAAPTGHVPIPPVPPAESGDHVAVGPPATVAAPPAEAAAPADVALANARRDYEQGQYQQAIDAFGLALHTRPADADALLGRGRSHLAMKQFDPAIADLRQILPERAEARAALAEAYFQRGLAATDAAEYDKAITDFQQAIQLDADGSLGYRGREEYAAAYRQRGTAELIDGDFDRAIADLTAANEYNPQDAAVYTRLGGAYFKKDDYAKAVENYTAAIDLDDNDADYVYRGRAYLQEEKLALAIGDFSKAIALNAQNAEAYTARGEAYMQQDDPNRAIADLDRAVEFCQQDPEKKPQLETAYYYRAYGQILAGHNDAAAADCTAMLALGANAMPNLHELLAALADAFATEGQKQKAVDWIDKAIEHAPDKQTEDAYRTQKAAYQAGKS